ncbi:MAG: ABC transporter permease [Bacteroidota bacterium]
MANFRTPKFANRLLSKFISNTYLEEFLGDLQEVYIERLENKGKIYAWLMYWVDTVHLVFGFSSTQKFHTSNHNFMIAYYLKFALRNIRLNFAFSIINIAGLAVGLASCLIIAQYLSHEWSYDQFHSDFEKVYRIRQSTHQGTDFITRANTFSRLAYEMNQTLPAVETACRLHKAEGNITVKVGESLFREESVMGSDPNFFEIFEFEFIYGSPETALAEPKSIILTQALSEKYFGYANPIGQELEINGAYGFWSKNGYQSTVTHIVTGVIENLPSNTHLDFDMLISFSLYQDIEQELNNWGSSFYTYFKLNDASQISLIYNQLPVIAEKYRPDQGIALDIQKLSEIHLNSNMVDEIKKNGNKKVNWLLSGVATLILLIAGTNYVNFSTAKAISRHKEVGIRKIYWANSSQLFYQLLTEAFVINCLSMVIGIALIVVSQSFLTAFLGFNLVSEVFNLSTLILIVFLIGSGTIASGAYPAFYISRLKPARTIQANPKQDSSKSTFRKTLITFQFTVSILVIGCAIILYSQLNFMKTKELGLDINNSLVINGPRIGFDTDSIYQSRLTHFKAEALRLFNIAGITIANFIPGKDIRGRAAGYVRKINDREESANTYYFSQVDYNFMSYFQINLISGRTFNEESGSDMRSVVINRESLHLLGFESAEEAIGEKIVYRMNSTPEIIGVVENFHQYSLQRDFQPIIFEVRNAPKAYFYLKTEGKIDPSNVGQLRKLWTDIFPDNAFNYFYLEDFYANQYASDDQYMRAFTLFSLLAVFVASMGLVGLAYYLAAHRIKEIGIRKTLGAELVDIFYLLSRGFAGIILAASIISVPLIYFIGNSWLMAYAFRIEITWWMPATAILILICITISIITSQTIKSYKSNPVISLRKND